MRRVTLLLAGLTLTVLAFDAGRSGAKTEEELEIERELEEEERAAKEKDSSRRKNHNLGKMHDSLDKKCGKDDNCRFERNSDGSGFKLVIDTKKGTAGGPQYSPQEDLELHQQGSSWAEKYGSKQSKAKSNGRKTKTKVQPDKAKRIDDVESMLRQVGIDASGKAGAV
jgi:hypothetical protein